MSGTGHMHSINTILRNNRNLLRKLSFFKRDSSFMSARKTYLTFIIITILLGLLSRTNLIPKLIYPYIGDFFYALMFFFIIGFLFPNMTSLKKVLISIGICYLIELSQFYQSDWINDIRNNKLGGLIFGFGFLWSDIISYTLGGFTGFIFEKIYYSRIELSKKTNANTS